METMTKPRPSNVRRLDSTGSSSTPSAMTWSVGWLCASAIGPPSRKLWTYGGKGLVIATKLVVIEWRSQRGKGRALGCLDGAAEREASVAVMHQNSKEWRVSQLAWKSSYRRITQPLINFVMTGRFADEPDISCVCINVCKTRVRATLFAHMDQSLLGYARPDYTRVF